MRIVFLGIGGVGGYMGANFLRSEMEHEITLIGRGSHQEAIDTAGLRVVGDTEEFTVLVPKTKLDGSYDLVILGVKSYDFEAAITQIKPHITEQSIVIAFANGVSHKAFLQERLNAKVLEGAVYILSHIEEPGVIRKKGNVFAAVIGSEIYKEEVLIVEALFKKAKLRVKTPENITEALWKKYLFISAFATLSSYYDCSIREVYETHREVCETLLNEIVAVAEAQGIMIRDELPKALQTASSLPQEASTSMHLDFQNTRRNELEVLTYDVIRLGLELGVKSPLYEKMYYALKAKESKLNKT
ncbi:MAG: 2-dehydropantoate 2-reductase [Campylobacterota bacterium]|nr:2-dehydropantoate 2-reductase [Campylobacterota bacterium]